MARLVIISNRVAVPERDAANRAGGLEVAVRATLKGQPGIWFGWSGQVSDQPSTRTVEDGGISYIVTDLRDEDYQEYYNGFANRVLWPILHYRLDLAEFSTRDPFLQNNVRRRGASLRLSVAVARTCPPAWYSV